MQNARAAVVLIALGMAACKGGDDKSKAGTGTASGAGGGGGGGDESCNAVVVCKSIPSAHVDELCGTKTASTTPVDTTADIQADSCEYVDDKHNQVAFVGRVCVSPKIGGAKQAKMPYESTKSQPLGPDGKQTDLSGLGDQAYFRVDGNKVEMDAQLRVLAGNRIYTLSSKFKPPQTGEAIKEKCLTPLLKEAMAL